MADCFVCEIPLATTPRQESALAKRFEAARQIYNACLGEALKRLRRMRESRDWQRARAMQKSQAKADLFAKLKSQHEFKKSALERYAIACKNGAFKEHLGAHETQAMAKRAFNAVEQYAYGRRGRPRFKGYRGLHSVEGKSNQACIRWRDDKVMWKGLELKPLLAPQRRDSWQSEALERETKYCRIVRRQVRSQTRWYVQLVQAGLPPVQDKHVRAKGVVGLDVGPSTIAIVSEQAASLETFCPSIEQPWNESRRLLRAMDRSRRATNPENYNDDGTVRTGYKRWQRSKRYLKLASARAEQERRLAAERKRSHGELSNKILAQGVSIKTEKLSYRSFQRNFGKSVKVRAPGMFIELLRRKAESAGGQVEEFATWSTKLSQVCHGCGREEKKPLSLRTHACPCGVGPLQRDLYSAFLARFVSQGKLDARRAQEAFPAAEPLLGQAASSSCQSAIRRALRASSAVQGKGSRADRLSKEDRDSPRPQTTYRHLDVREGCGEVSLVSSRTPGL